MPGGALASKAYAKPGIYLSGYARAVEGVVTACLLLVRPARPVESGNLNQPRQRLLEEVEVMLMQSWTMEWFAYLNAIILAWAALAYGYRQYVRKDHRRG